MARRSPEFEALSGKCDRVVFGLADDELISALVMFHGADEPLRTKLGLKKEMDTSMVLGFRDAVVKYGGLTWKQRKVARRMVKYGMLFLERSAFLGALRNKLATDP